MSNSLKKDQRNLAHALRDQRGGVAVMFTLAVIPIVFLSLVMIDFSRASTARANMQEALDAATLLTARSTAITTLEIQAAGDGAYKAQVATNLGITPVSDTFASGANNTITGDATGTVQTMLAGHLFAGGAIPIAAHSEVVRSMNKLEIAMVLDTTGSMSGSKITNLQSAATNFVNTMSVASAQALTASIPNAVKIAIVPFSTTVKVSAPLSFATSTYNTTTFSMSGVPIWLDGRAQSTPCNLDIFTIPAACLARVDRFLMLKQMSTPWGGCVENRKYPYDTTDDAPDVTKPDTLFTPFFWPDGPDSDYTKVSFGTFKNDYIDDGYPTNSNSTVLPGYKTAQGNAAKYTAAPKSGTWSQGSGYGANLTYGPNGGCAMQQMQRLGNNFPSMDTTISGLVASGETNIPIGLAWGWHAISPNAPLADGAPYGTANTTKIIVLMTDGDNTMNDSGDGNGSWYHGYGFIWQNKLGTTSSSSATGKLNARMIELCTNIKAKGIVIYTVGVGVSAASQTLLQQCATTTSQYYSVDAAGSNMNAAFSAIAGSIQNLRISK